jgi:hypothetical protein
MVAFPKFAAMRLRYPPSVWPERLACPPDQLEEDELLQAARPRARPASTAMAPARPRLPRIVESSREIMPGLLFETFSKCFYEVS